MKTNEGSVGRQATVYAEGTSGAAPGTTLKEYRATGAMASRLATRLLTQTRHASPHRQPNAVGNDKARNRLQKLKVRFWVTSLCGVLGLAACGGGEGTPPLDSAGGDKRTTALLQNFIADDPLGGDNGLPTSPAAPLSYGPINLGVDVDGNAIQAVDEQDLRYFDGHYYLYGPSFTCGAFNYAPGVNTGPLIPTNPRSFYRYCGLTIYQSGDLMNWKLVGTQYIQDPTTGEHYYVKKPRVVYSPKTKLYNMWFLNGQAALTTDSKVGKYYIVQSTSPVGPWSAPIEPTVATGSFGPVDFSINTGPDGTSYIATSHAGVNILRLNDEKTGTVDETQVNIDPGTPFGNTLFGGIGLSYHKGWWYITGTNLCGNCLAAKFFYLRARDPRGPWMNPTDDSTTQPLRPALLSEDSGMAQLKSSVMLPDANGNTHVLVTGTHYRSSPTGAPGTQVSQPGDSNLALSGLYLTPLRFDEQGRILPLNVTSTYEFPLAKPVATTPPPTYQANLGIDNNRAVVQSWDVKQGDSIAALLPAVFQRTPDLSSSAVGTAVVQQPHVNAPLLAKLQLPDGRVHDWSIDPRTVSWAPTKVPLNLPEVFNGPGRVTLTLSTTATNGGYGVAVGKKGTLLNSQYSAVKSGVATVLPMAEMLVATSKDFEVLPKITMQPRSLRVQAGSSIGLLVRADGMGLGYQWQRNGQVILAPDGYNESTTAALRLSNVTVADSGTYTVTVFNQVGSVTSIPVTVEVMP